MNAGDNAKVILQAAIATVVLAIVIAARTAPLAELTKVREVIYAHVAQPVPSNPDMEKEGVLRARAQAELDLPTELDTEEPRTIASQFIQQIFVNSGGARYLPPLAAHCSILSGTSKDKVRRVRNDNNPTDQRQRMTI